MRRRRGDALREMVGDGLALWSLRLSQICEHSLVLREPGYKAKGNLLHCKNIWVTSTILWSSQLHACCVRDTLHTSRDASNLIESLSVVETLLLFVNLGSSCRKPSYLATFLDNHATKELPQGECVGSKKHQTLPEMLIYRPSARWS